MVSGSYSSISANTTPNFQIIGSPASCFHLDREGKPE